MYKSKIKEINERDIKQHPDYLKAIAWVKHANESKSDNTHKVDLAQQSFPSVVFNKPLEDKVFHLEKHWMGFMFLSVEINGLPYKFLLDTGAQISCISETISDNEGIVKSVETVEVGDAGGYKSDMSMCYTKSMSVCNFSVENLPMLILGGHQLTLKVLGKTLYKVDGIIGWDVLSKIDFEIDYAKQMIVVRKSELLTLNNFIKSDFPTVLVEDENGQILKFGLDLGARKSWINDKLIEKNQLRVIKEKNKTAYGVNGMMSQASKTVAKFDILLKNSQIKFKHISTGFTGFLNDFELDGVLGMDVIKTRKVTISNSKGVLKLNKPQNRFK